MRHALKKYQSSRKIAKALEVNQTTIIRKLKKYNLNDQIGE
ncbi:TyrR/PhhR family helix-turn-helix DNA-binding protein [Neobacillus sp. OS1-33]